MFQGKLNSTYFKYIVMASFILALPVLAAGATYYVDAASGSNGDAGTSPATAWKTITHAAATVPAGTSGAPNMIMVYAGTYDNTTNGEIFPINFANDYVSLTGAGTGSTLIDAEAAPNALNVDAVGFSISGFTFENTDTALTISESGFTITSCEFDTTVNNGVSANLLRTDLVTDFIYHAVTVSYNTFKTNNQGMTIQAFIDSDSTTENLALTVEDITITDNSFPLSSGNGFFGPFIQIMEFYNSTVSIGDAVVSNNTFTGGNSGIGFFSVIYAMEDCLATVGNLTVSGNTFTDLSGNAIHVDYWDSGSHEGNTSVVFGDLTITNNTVNTSNYATFPINSGIHVSDLGFYSGLFDESSITTGTTNVTNNSVDVSGQAFIANFLVISGLGEEFWDDQVMVNMGSFNATGNSFTSNAANAAIIAYSSIATSIYGQSAISFEPLTFSNNTLVSEAQALVLSLASTGVNMLENSSLAMDGITINNNTVTSNNDDAVLVNFAGFGNLMGGSASFSFAPLNINSNTLTAGNGDSVRYDFSGVGFDLYDNAAFTMSPITMDNNIMNATGGNGVNILYLPASLASNLENNAQATLPDWIITNNSIDVTGGYSGIKFASDENPYDNYNHSQATFGSLLIDSNTFNPNKDAGMDYGINLYHEDAGYYLYGPSMTLYGATTIINNLFYSITTDAIGIEYDYIGYDMTGNPTLTVGGIEIGNNTIDKSDYGIEADIGDVQTMDAATVSFGGLDIHDNTFSQITSTAVGVYHDSSNSDPMTATLLIESPTITFNTMSGNTTTGSGIYLYVNNATDGITFGTPSILNNTVSDFDNGIRLDTVEEASFSCNYLENNSKGLSVASAGGFTLSMNSLVDNTVAGIFIDNGYAATVTAEKNWWGDKLGPAACASCNGIVPGDMGSVDYDPWLSYQPQKSRCGIPFPWVMFTPATTGMTPTP